MYQNIHFNRNQETSIARIIMHSTISKEQIECALQTTSDNVRKIILATNVAESSITVPDVKYSKYRNLKCLMLLFNLTFITIYSQSSISV